MMRVVDMINTIKILRVAIYFNTFILHLTVTFGSVKFTLGEMSENILVQILCINLEHQASSLQMTISIYHHVVAPRMNWPIILSCDRCQNHITYQNMK